MTELMTNLILVMATLAGMAVLARLWVLVGRDDDALFGRER